MACALCISSARLPAAFPRRLTGSCPLNRTLFVKSTFFFATAVSKPPDLGPATKSKNTKEESLFIVESDGGAERVSGAGSEFSLVQYGRTPEASKHRRATLYPF